MLEIIDREVPYMNGISLTTYGIQGYWQHKRGENGRKGRYENQETPNNNNK
jgi:hypothetical protein